MLTYCLKCKKDKENIYSKMLKTKDGKSMLSSKCALCGNKNSRFLKEQESKGFISKIDLKTPLNKIPILGDALF